MTKNDLIKQLSAETKLPKEYAEKAVNGLMQVMGDAFKNGESITLRGFGTFEVKKLTGRKGRDIRMGKTIELPDTYKVKFVPCAELKEAMKL